MFGRQAQLLRELVGERFNDARNLVRHALQRANDWKALYGIATIAEAYTRGDIHLHLHLRLRELSSGGVEGVDSTLAGAVRRYVCKPTDLCIRVKRHPSIEVDMTRQPSEMQRVRSGKENGDEAVFVGIVQLLQKKKGAALIPVPSLVWLKRLDMSQMFGINALNDVQAISSPTITVEVGNVLDRSANQIDREGGSVIRLTNERVIESQLPCETVKGRPQIVGNFANHSSPDWWQRFRPSLDSEDVMVGLRIILGYADFIEVVPKECFNLVLQSYDLESCPADLLSWPIKRMHHDVYSEAILGRR